MILSITIAFLFFKSISINYVYGTDSTEWQQNRLHDNLRSDYLTFINQDKVLNPWGSSVDEGWTRPITSENNEWNLHQHQIHHTRLVPISQHIEISKPIAVPVYKNIGIPLAQPVGIPVKHVTAIGIPQPYPVHIPVVQSVPIPVIKTVARIIEKKIPYPIEKIIPVPIVKPVPIHIEKRIPVSVEKTYPIHVPIYKPILHQYKRHGWKR